MLKLHKLQQLFVNGLDEKENAILNCINSDSKLSKKDHLAIYQSSIRGALQKVLREIYPVCAKLVGDDFFIGMSNVYIKQTQSLAPDIASYGSNFAEFIASFEPAKSLPYLSDVAALEWAWHNAYSGRDSQGIDFEKLAECYEQAGDKIIFLLPANSSLIFSIYPIHRIWEVNQDGFEGKPTIILEENKKYYFFIWRNELEMRIDLLDETEWTMLKLIQTQLKLGELYETIKELLPNIDFESLLPTMVRRGWLAEFKME